MMRRLKWLIPLLVFGAVGEPLISCRCRREEEEGLRRGQAPFLVSCQPYSITAIHSVPLWRMTYLSQIIPVTPSEVLNFQNSNLKYEWQCVLCTVYLRPGLARRLHKDTYLHQHRRGSKHCKAGYQYWRWALPHFRRRTGTGTAGKHHWHTSSRCSGQHRRQRRYPHLLDRLEREITHVTGAWWRIYVSVHSVTIGSDNGLFVVCLVPSH